MGDYNIYRDLIQQNILYSCFLQSKNILDIRLVNTMVDVMVDFIISEGPAAVKIGKEIKSREVVKAVYLKLKYDHIDLVLEKFNEQCHQITHKKAYLRTMLYNSYLEIDAHYINLVNSDLMAHRNAI